MKKFLTAALLTAGILTSSNCFAALESSYDSNNKVFTTKSEEVIVLDDGANQLKVVFFKEYRGISKVSLKNANRPQPVYGVRMYVEGTKPYVFADNANYWQEHNYTYEEMGILKEREAKREAVEKEKQKARAEGKKYVAPENDQNDEGDDLELRKKKRNASTLIYLKVASETSRELKGKKLYEFNNPIAKDEASKDLRHSLEDKAEALHLAKLEKTNPEEAARIREEKLQQEAQRRVEERAALVEKVKAAREAFKKFEAEQKAADEGVIYTSKAEGLIPEKDNFWNKINDSSLKRIPMFFEVKFMSGGANQRIWLKTEKLKELQELMAYDLYKDKANMQKLLIGKY